MYFEGYPYIELFAVFVSQVLLDVSTNQVLTGVDGKQGLHAISGNPFLTIRHRFSNAEN